MARTFQSRHSRYWPGSRTAKTRSCVSWKASSSARTSPLVSQASRDRHVELPDLRPVAGLDDELLARRDRVDVGEARRGTRRPRASTVGERLVDGVGVERARLGVAAARELGDDVGVERAAGGERAGRGRDEQHARQPSSRAIGTTFRPEAPPPATIVISRGSIPCAIVISRIAPTMFSVAIVSAA